MTTKPAERGAASILLELKAGNIWIIHGTDKVTLGVLRNAPAGSWDRIFKLFEEMAFDLEH